METKNFKPTVAAWEKPTKNGGTYLSVKLATGEWVNLFKNSYKKPGSKEPDWKELPPKKDDAGAPPPINDDDKIPF